MRVCGRIAREILCVVRITADTEFYVLCDGKNAGLQLRRVWDFARCAYRNRCRFAIALRMKLHVVAYAVPDAESIVCIFLFTNVRIL
jgi:hypothetical protein